MPNDKWFYLENVLFRLPENFCGDEREAMTLFLEYMSKILLIKDERLEFVKTNFKLSDLDEEMQDLLITEIDSLSENDNATFGYCIVEDDLIDD